MQYQELTNEDMALIEAVSAKLNDAFQAPNHKLASAILTDEGNTHYGINLRAHHVRRASVCAEPGAINSVFMAKETPRVIVAVRKADEQSPAVVANPCGLCREMATDYYPDVSVIVSTPEGLKKVRSLDLLPLKFST